MNTYTNILEMVGNTPLLRLRQIEEAYDLDVELYAKLESYNPTGSIKDRASLEMIKDALVSKRIEKGALLIEATSGNTGIGLAAFAKYFDLKVVIVMPDSMSQERINLMKAYGAEVVLTEGAKGMEGSLLKAQEIHLNHPNSMIVSQFDNPANKKAHIQTAQELEKALNGDIDYIIAGIGTGGTISGLGEYFKDTKTKMIGIEPYESPLLSKGEAHPHKIQGIGANFIPSLLNQSVIEEILLIKGNDAILGAKELMSLESVFVGISSGAALKGAIKLIKEKDLHNQKIVVIMPDRGDRYYSTEMFKYE